MWLGVHYAFGYLVVLVSLAALLWRPARRYVLYALVVQIVIGGVVWVTRGVAPPALHWILALLVGGVYAMANAFERRGRPNMAVVGTLALGFVVIAYIFYLGMHAVGA